MEDQGRTQLRHVQTAPGTYEVRQVVTPEVRELRRQGGPAEPEPLTWEEYLSLPAWKRGGMTKERDEDGNTLD